jgi:glutaredoxin
VTFSPSPDKRAEAGYRGRERVELFTRTGCHLCDEARIVVTRVVDELGEQLIEHDIDADPEKARRFGEQVPVVFVDGVQIDFWRVSESRLRAALERGRS